MHTIAPWHQCFTFIVKFLLCFLSVYFGFHNLRLVKVQIETLWKDDNQGITLYFESPPVPKRSPGHPFLFQNLSSLNKSKNRQSLHENLLSVLFQRNYISYFFSSLTEVTSTRIVPSFLIGSF